MRRRLLALALALAAVAAVALILGIRHLAGNAPGDGPLVPETPAVRADDVAPFADPFAYDPDERAAFEARAAAGTSHVIYAQSPGGAEATAARTARYRRLVERAARTAGVDADSLEGLVLLESAGRPDAIAGGGEEVDGAVGLTQILAETGQNLLGMEIDVAESERLTRRLARERERLSRSPSLRRARRIARLERARRRADDRFDPAKALAGTARYLRLARRRFGREDLAFVSYHMGIGNLEGIVRAFVGDEADPDTPIAEVVRDAGLTYAQLYFETTPLRHRAAYRRLSRLSDDTSNYLWKVLGGREILRLHRDDPAALARRAALQTSKNSAEEVLHPGDDAERFATPGQLRAAWDDDAIVPFPDQGARLGFARDGQMGELARRVGQAPTLYRGLRPGALALAIYVGAQVRAISRDPTPLRVTSTVRDGRYQRELVGANREATRNYSLHTTGWAFDVARDYGSRRQALAFQFVLDRLAALNLIAWVREPGAIHVTAAEEAERLEPLLERIGG